MSPPVLYSQEFLPRAGNMSLPVPQGWQIKGFDFHLKVNPALAHRLQTEVQSRNRVLRLLLSLPTHCCGLQSAAYQQQEDNQFLLPGDGVRTSNLQYVSKA